jgi:site-specific recombinase XerD
MAIGTMIMDENKSKSNICLLINRNVANGISPYRLVSANGSGIDETNEYLDMLAIRGLSLRTIRAYAYDLLNFFRWLVYENIHLSDITKSLLLKYIRYQRDQSSGKQTAPTTINHRLIVIRCLYKFHFNNPIPSGTRSPKEKPHFFTQRMPSDPGYAYAIRPRNPSLRVKVSHHIIQPLTHSEVSQFIQSLKTWRDITITAFMLLCGLRSNEVITIKMDDLRFSENQVLIHGKGNKERIIPLPRTLIFALENYLKLEKPKISTDNLFVTLKGPNRGYPLSREGFRSIFRYYRKKSGISNANPHRFRHTFGAVMAKAGISVVSLMKLMGHSSIQTTMGYVNISVNDIKQEFHKVTAKLFAQEIENGPKTDSSI